MAGPEAYVAIGGQNKSLLEAYVAVGGQYKQLSDIHTAVGGSNKVAYSPGATYTWTLTPVGNNPFRWTLDLTAANASYAVISVTDHRDLTVQADTNGDLTWTRQHGPGVPKKTYYNSVKLYDQFGRLTEGIPTLSYAVPAPVAPPKPTFSNVSSSGFRASIPAQTEASSYRWDINSPPGGLYVTDTTFDVSGRSASTRYGIRVQSIVKGVAGSWSPIGYVTTSAPSYTKGKYTLNPSSSYSYSPSYSYSYWRPASEGIRAGSANPWAPPNRGTQSGWIFYNTGDSVHRTLRTALSRGARVTAVRVYLRRRTSSHGYYYNDPRANLAFHTHGYGSKPSGRPGWSRSWTSGHGWNRGEGKWVGLPLWMGTALINGGGLAVGGYYSPYYLFEGVGWGSTGKVEITIA